MVNICSLRLGTCNHDSHIHVIFLLGSVIKTSILRCVFFGRFQYTTYID